MATPELRTLRHKYKVAYTSYLNCVQLLSVASAKGECPPDPILDGEEKALTDLNACRKALLQALCRHRPFAVP
jgi:hypothetical protein